MIQWFNDTDPMTVGISQLTIRATDDPRLVRRPRATWTDDSTRAEPKSGFRLDVLYGPELDLCPGVNGPAAVPCMPFVSAA